jgi:DNA modification methylase
MAKDLDSLIESRKIRQKVIAKYGDVPTSVWDIDYALGKEILELDDRKQAEVSIEKHKTMGYDPKFKVAFNMSSRSVRGTNEDSGLSTFPPDLVRRVCLFYSNEGDTVLDPFAGHNSRMQVVYNMNRNYIGYDVCKKFMEFNRAVEAEITGKGKQTLLYDSPTSIVLHEQSSEKIAEEENSVDLVFTSPPYFGVEYYGPEPEQLGLSKSYDEFLEKMGVIVKESYRVLKQGKYCVFNINDFRSNNEFYLYHADIIQLFRKTGFKMWDCIVIKWKNVMSSCFASQVEDRKICAKAHEYLIVGKKV